ncbi:hypothetical protein [Streptomyces sp. NPDC048663]|uniref:hypothetical protein n=1 Tax=Streptomyces sp. NPDC048663 TaxID=3155638 RepID=UPI00342017A5
MTTLTTREGWESFADTMAKRLADLPAAPGKQLLHVSQAELAADSFFTHHLDAAEHHVVYDPRQVKATTVRQLLGIYIDFTEGPILDGCRDRYYDNDGDGPAQIWAILIEEIDRTQDPDGVMAQVLEVIEGRALDARDGEASCPSL